MAIPVVASAAAEAAVASDPPYCRSHYRRSSSYSWRTWATNNRRRMAGDFHKLCHRRHRRCLLTRDVVANYSVAYLCLKIGWFWWPPPSAPTAIILLGLNVTCRWSWSSLVSLCVVPRKPLRNGLYVLLSTANYYLRLTCFTCFALFTGIYFSSALTASEATITLRIGGWVGRNQSGWVSGTTRTPTGTARRTVDDEEETQKLIVIYT